MTKQTINFTLPTLATPPTPNLTSIIQRLPLVSIRTQVSIALVLLAERCSPHPTRVFAYAWLPFVVIFADRVEVQAELDTQLISYASLFRTKSFCVALPQKFKFSESQVF